MKAAIGVLLAAALWGSAAADDAKLEDFAGEWVGKVTVETAGPTEFPTSVRDTGVTVTPDGQGGFVLEWSTVQRESGDPNAPEEKVRETEVTFPKGEAANRWVAAGADPVAGKAQWLARLEGQTLTVTGYAVQENGKAELQTYRRTIENGVMGLTYTRVVEGDVLRRASGTLTRFAQ